MAQTETARATVYLDGKQAEAALGALAEKAKGLRKDLKEALDAGNTVKYDKLRAELSRVESVQRSVTKESFDVAKVLRNINNVSWRDLEKAQKAVIAQMKGMTRGTEEYAAKQKDLGLLRAELSGISGIATKQTGILGKLRDTAAELLPAFGLAAIALGLKNIFTTADDSYVKFEERVDNLSALTGLEGEQLDWLSKKAKETSVSTVEGNVRITQSAESIVDAYTKVGSQRPELLKVKEDLASVSQEAIILSAAAKSELEPAVEGLTMTLNQFDMAADQSRRIINVLAAGSMVGAGEIPYLTEAMEKSGTTANLMKIPLEQWAGAIESIAPYYKQASEAGNSFDKVLLTMKQKQIGYVNGVFDMNTALDQLEKRYAAGETATDIFMKEHSKMGELLVLNRGKMDEYTKAVTGSNIAIEQAAKNTDNEVAKRAQAQNGINNLYLEFGAKIAPLITKGITSGAELLRIAIEYRTVLIPLAAALAAYVVMAKLKVFWDVTQKGSVILASAAQALFTGNLTRATAAMRMFNTVTKLNPFILLASLIASAGIALFAYTKRSDAAVVAQRSLNDISVTAQQNIASERVELQQLLKVAQNETLSKVTRQEAMAKINQISPEYLGGLTLETINTDKAKTATEQYITSLEKKARAQANFDRMVEIQKEETSLNAGIGGEPGVGTKVWNAVSRPFLYNQLNASSKQKNINARLEELRIEKLSLNDDASSNYVPPPKPSGSGGGDGGKPTETPEEKKAREKAEKAALKTAEKVEKTKLELVEAANAHIVASINKSHLEGKTSESQYNADLLEQEFIFLQGKMDIYKVGSKEYEDASAAFTEKQVKASEQVKDLLVKAEKELADAKIANLKDGIDKEKALENNRWADELAGLKKRLADITGTSVDEVALRKSINDIIEQNEKAHTEKMRILNSADDIAKLEKQQKDFGNINDSADNYSTSTPWLSGKDLNAFFDSRKDVIEQAFIVEKKLAGDNQKLQKAAEEKHNVDISKLEKQKVDATHDAALRRIGIAQDFLGALSGIVDQESALGKALFLFQQGLAVASIWISTAKANAEAMATLILPPLYLPVMAANTTMAIVQTALVAAQTVGNFVASGKKGKQSGGYADSDSNDSTPVGVYHANEFIASGPAVRNPTIKPVLDIIDIAQRSGTIRSLNLPAMLGQSGRQSGGYASPGPATSVPSSVIPGSSPELMAIMTKISAQLDKPITANVAAYGGKGSVADSIKQIANLAKSLGI
ncbi:MAG TPA: phage tail tape measure protein [Prolixibacteraceae bacterium]|nr:phage tail tape measure protein [Prolixibacteraceae bacterium]